MKKMFSIIALMFMLFCLTLPMAMAGPSDTYVLYPISADPCQNPSVAKSSALISTGTNTTSLVVALTAAKSIYVCSVGAYLTGTTTLTTFELVSGTSTTYPCDTGSASLTGLRGITSAEGTNVYMGYGGTIFKTASAKQLCSVTTGTSSNVVGVVTYVKQ
jgi:hypothetical protein